MALTCQGHIDLQGVWKLNLDNNKFFQNIFVSQERETDFILIVLLIIANQVTHV